MKKIVAIVLALAMALSLAACGPSIKEKPETTAADKESAAETETVTETENETEAQTETEAESESLLPEGFRFGQMITDDIPEGTLDGDTYINEYLGMAFTAPSGWQMGTEEDLQTLQGVVSSFMNSEEYDKLLDEGTVLYEMYAAKTDGSESVNITMGKGAAYGGVDVLESDLMLSSIAAGVEKQFEDAGIDTTTSIGEEEFMGEDCPAIYLTAKANGITIEETMVMIIYGDYILQVTASAPTSERTIEILDMFYSSLEPRPTQEATEAAGNDAAAGDAPFGTLSDGAYVNETFNIAFRESAGWNVYSLEELLSSEGYSLDQAEEYYARLDGMGGTVYELMAENADSTKIVYVNLININGLSALGGNEEFLNTVADETLAGMQSAGEMKNSSIEDREFNGRIWKEIEMEISISGMDCAETIMLAMEGDYICQITAGSFGTTEVEDILSMFTQAGSL